MATLPLDAHGFRGAILLRPGRFLVSGQLHLNVSGVVLRGSGAGPNGTTIVADGHDRRTLIEAGGRPDSIARQRRSNHRRNRTRRSSPPHRRIHRRPRRRRSRRRHPPQHAGVDLRHRHERPARHLRQPAPRLEARLAQPRLGPHHHLHQRHQPNRSRSTPPSPPSMQKKYGGGTVVKIESNPALENIGIEDLTPRERLRQELPQG